MRLSARARGFESHRFRQTKKDAVWPPFKFGKVKQGGRTPPGMSAKQDDPVNHLFPNEGSFVMIIRNASSMNIMIIDGGQQ